MSDKRTFQKLRLLVQIRTLWRRAARMPHALAARLLDGEFFGRLSTESMLATVESACDVFQPDLILREPCAYAGAIVATRRDLPPRQRSQILR